jgi:hypothetical protein
MGESRFRAVSGGRWQIDATTINWKRKLGGMDRLNLGLLREEHAANAVTVIQM